MPKKYEIDLEDSYIEVPKDIQKQIVSDYLEKYYLMALTISIFIIGFLLGVLAHAL